MSNRVLVCLVVGDCTKHGSLVGNHQRLNTLQTVKLPPEPAPAAPAATQGATLNHFRWFFTVLVVASGNISGSF